MPHKPDPKQRQFEFSLRRKAFRRRWGVPSQVKHLLRVLEDFAGLERDTCWPSYKTISEAMDVSEKTVGRLVDEAQRLELLIVLKRRDREAKAKRYKIRRAQYHGLAGLLDDRLELIPEDDLTGQVVRSDSNSHRTSCPVNPARSPDKLSGQPESHRTKTTVSPDKLSAGYLLLDCEEDRSSSPLPPDGWAEVEEALRRFGLGDWRGATEAARATGCNARQTLDLIAEATRRRSDWKTPEGVLHARLRNAHPSADPASGWPPPSPERRAQRTAEAQATAAAQTLQAIRTEEAAAALDRAEAESRLAELEARHGAAFDGLEPAIAAQVIREALTGTILLRSWQRSRDRPLDSLTRRKVLEHLDRKTTPVPVA